MFLMLVMMACMAESRVLPVPSGAAEAAQCDDNHATCTEGDSIRRFMDVLAHECAGIEPLEDSNDDLRVVIETEKICQDNGEIFKTLKLFQSSIEDKLNEYL